MDRYQVLKTMDLMDGQNCHLMNLHFLVIVFLSLPDFFNFFSLILIHASCSYGKDFVVALRSVEDILPFVPLGYTQMVHAHVRLSRGLKSQASVQVFHVL